MGRQIGHFEVLEVLGSGGMGVVYKARNTHHGQFVAIKVLSEELAGDTEAQERFRREARAASMLDHPNISKVLEVGEQDGRPYLIMPLIEGLTLRACIPSKQFTIKEILNISSQLTSALDAAHAKGIVHRDIKPGNIIIDQAGEAKVLDFGLAKRVLGRPGGPAESSFSAGWGKTLTTTGMPLGTIEYMSPEQVRGEELDARTDIFSLGLVIYEMATRRRAFDGSTPGILLEAVLTRTPVAPSQLNPDLPPAFDQIIEKLLEKDRELRYQTAADLLADLRRLRRDEDSASTAPLSARPEFGRGAPKQRTAAPGRGPRRVSPTVRGAIVAASVLLLALLIGFFILPPRVPALAERDTIVLTEFSNMTGDPVFDGTLKQALAVELWQSPYLNIFPERRIREALRLMGRSPDDRVTSEVAREICLREGAKALIAGSISSLGNNYVITLEAVDAQSGETIASEQSESAGKEKVLQSLGRSASRLRAKLGESLSSIEKFDAPLDRATTPSLEALRAFSLGNAERERGAEFNSIPLYKRALELDPDFALAEARLAAVYANMGEESPAVAHARRAYELRDGVSERERYYITAHYHGTVTGDLGKSVENYEMWRRAYPRDATPATNLSAVFNDLGQFDRALHEAQSSARLVNTNKGIMLINIAAAHMGSGRFLAARAVLEQMLSENPDSSSAPVVFFMVGCAERDDALMQRLLARADGKETEAPLHLLQAQTLASRGELSKSREIFRHTLELARRFKRHNLEANTHARQAVAESLLGNSGPARASAAAALKLSPGKETRALAALALARVGDIGRARKVASELEEQYPEDILMNAVSVPAIRAAIEVERGRPDRAVELLHSAAPYELGFAAGVGPTFLRGQAFLRARDGARAAAEFERIISRPGVEAVSLVHSLAWLELARAAALAGDRARSHEAFQEFFERWKNADAGLPFLQQANSEFAPQ